MTKDQAMQQVVDILNGMPAKLNAVTKMMKRPETKAAMEQLEADFAKAAEQANAALVAAVDAPAGGIDAD